MLSVVLLIVAALVGYQAGRAHERRALKRQYDYLAEREAKLGGAQRRLLDLCDMTERAILDPADIRAHIDAWYS